MIPYQQYDHVHMIADEVLLVATDSRAEDLVTAALDGHVEPRVTTGVGALDSLHEREMDTLIVTDPLAATDPIDCIRDIRREFPSLPIVLISDSDGGMLASDALAAGVDDYVPLSVVSTDPDRLRLGLDRAVRARSLSDPSEELAALHTATREMIEADSAAALAERVIDAGANVLALDYACVYRFDSDEDQLTPVAWTEQLETTVGGLLPLATDSLAWPAFVNDATKYYADVSTVDRDPTQGTTLRTELFVPLGDYGLLCVSSPAPDAFDAHERETVSVLGANATAAFDAIARRAELRESERALRSQNQQLDQFVSVVSHDLRNPLNVAEGHLELAREECSSEHLATVADAHDRMYTLIEDLLRLAHSGQEADGLESVELGELVEVCWRHVTTAEATLVSDVDRRIRADRSRVQQLIENLVRNAVEHGGDDVTVTVGALDAGFYIEDDGPGIPDDERDDVFEAGYSTTEDGTGFGLSIVEQVAQAHGWDVRVTDGAGGGTRFEITGVEFTPA